VVRGRPAGLGEARRAKHDNSAERGLRLHEFVSRTAAIMRTRPVKCARITIVALVVIGLLAMVLVSCSSTEYYSSQTGRLKTVVTCGLMLGTEHFVDIFTISKTIKETRVTRCLTRGARGETTDSEWHGVHSTWSGVFGCSICGSRPIVLTDAAFMDFERVYGPFLSETEYRRLLKFCLQPDTIELGNEVSRPNFLEQMDESTDRAAKREFLAAKLGPHWARIADTVPPHPRPSDAD
jgi:hypothetical protein